MGHGIMSKFKSGAASGKHSFLGKTLSLSKGLASQHNPAPGKIMKSLNLSSLSKQKIGKLNLSMGN
jgi:hypothetical protein